MTVHAAQMDDFELLSRWQAGDASAGDNLVRRHYVSVRRFFEARFGHTGEDLTQRTFLACVETLQHGRVDGSFRSYLFGIARNTMLMHLRQSVQRSAAQPSVDRAFQPPPRTSITGIYARHEEHHYVLRTLVQLPPDLQIAAQLFYWEDLSTEEIGKVIEVPASTVRSRLARARQLMAKAIERMRLPRPLTETLCKDLDRWTRTVAVPGDANEVSAPTVRAAGESNNEDVS